VSGTSRKIRRVETAREVDFDDQIWPINVAILILSAFVAGWIIASMPFDEPRLLFNGWFLLGTLSLTVGGSIYAVWRLRGKVRHRVLFCAVLSLLVHVWILMIAASKFVPLFVLEEDENEHIEQNEPDIVIREQQWDPPEVIQEQQSFEEPILDEPPRPTPPRPVEQTAEEPTPDDVPQPPEEAFSPGGREPAVAESQRRVLTAPRRADHEAGGQISRQPWQHRPELNQPDIEPQIVQRPRQAAATAEAAEIAPRRHEPADVRITQRQTYEDVGSRLADLPNVDMARRASPQQPISDTPTTPAPTRTDSPPDVTPRTLAADPAPRQMSHPVPDSRAIEASVAQLPRQQAPAPRMPTPADDPAPTAPAPANPATGTQRRVEQPIQEARAPVPIPLRRPREITPPADTPRSVPDDLASVAPRSTPSDELRPQLPDRPDATAQRSPLNVPRPSTGAPAQPEASRPDIGAIAHNAPARRLPAAEPSSTPRPVRPGRTDTAPAAPRGVAGPAAAVESPTPGRSPSEPSPAPAFPTPNVPNAPSGVSPQLADGGSAGQRLPTMDALPQLPALPAPRRNPSQSGAPGNDASPSRPESLAAPSRSGVQAPSILPAGAARAFAALPAAGGAPGSRLEAAPSAMTERSGDQPPTGPSMAAAGTADLGAGAGQIVSRAGAPRGSGTGQPSMQPNAAAARPARSSGPAPSTVASGAVEAASSGAGARASDLAGLLAPSSNHRGSAASPGGTISQYAQQAVSGAGPAGASGMSGPVATSLDTRVARLESRPSRLSGGGVPRPDRSAGGANLPNAAAASANVTTATPGGGATAEAAPMPALLTGPPRSLPGLAGGLQDQPAGGAEASLTTDGPPLPDAAAARGLASQRRSPGGQDIGATESLTRHQTRSGADVPTITPAVPDVASRGAGGMTPSHGSQASSLPQGPSTALRHTSAAVRVDQSTLAGSAADLGVGSALAAVPPGRMRATGNTLPGNTAVSTRPGIERSSDTGPAVRSQQAAGARPSAADVAGGPSGGDRSPTGQTEAGRPATGDPSGAAAPTTAAGPGAAQPIEETGSLAGPSGNATAAAGTNRRSEDRPRTASSAGAVGGPQRRAGTVPSFGPSIAAAPVAPAGPLTGGVDTATESGLAARAAGPRRQSSGIEGALANHTPLEGATEAGPPAATPGTVRGPRRLPQGNQSGPPLAARVGRGPRRSDDVPGLPRGIADVVEQEPTTSGGPARTGAELDVADGAELNEPGRSDGGLPVQIVAAVGIGGLGHDPATEVGVHSRSARRDSPIVHPVLTRFIVERSGGELAIDARIRGQSVPELSARDPGRRAEIAEDRGGTKGSELAVEMGLDFFARNQFPDGHWSLHAQPDAAKWSADAGETLDDLVREARRLKSANHDKSLHRDALRTVSRALDKHADGDELTENEVQELARFVAGLGEMQSDTAATGLALLSYLGAGYTHLEDKHRSVVGRGIDWLVEHQQPSGELFTGGTNYARFYSHGIAAIALCEAYGMTKDPELREPARKAIQFIINTQHRTRGGWRYELDAQGRATETDTSVTGWMLMALKSAQMAGLDVPQSAFDKIDAWLDSATAPDQDDAGQYIYNPHADPTIAKQRSGLRPNLAMTSEAMLMRMYLGGDSSDPDLIAGADHLKENLPQLGNETRSLRDCYYWYYATQAMFHLQGEYWEAWNERLRPMATGNQVNSGPHVGSWNPRRPVLDRWGRAGGRHYVTAMHLLMLEVYYRHLPLFRELSEPAQRKVIVPTSRANVLDWRYTFEEPADDWATVRFDALEWSKGPGGFGTKDTPGAIVRTVWDSKQIWLRREFELPEMKTDGLSLLVHHDEEVEIYVNGVLAARATGNTADYEELPLLAQGRAALRPGKNILAVHCLQKTDGQYIDVGIVEVVTPE